MADGGRIATRVTLEGVSEIQSKLADLTKSADEAKEKSTNSSKIVTHAKQMFSEAAQEQSQ